MTPLVPWGGAAAPAVCAELRREGGVLRVRYELRGAPVRAAAPVPLPGPRDELWRSTCFELFCAGPGSAYQEWNFAPSGHWAHYCFADYRRRVEGPVAAPAIVVRREAWGLRVEAKIALPEALAGGEIEVGIACVVEDLRGRTCWLALHHPAERPDFHHRGGFVWRVPG